MQTFDLNSISVKSPCTVAWETMTGDDRKRFCNLCKLHVHNISGMTHDEALRMLAESESRMCVTFLRRADETIITRDCAPIRAARLRRRMAYAIASSMLLLLQAGFWYSRHELHSGESDTTATLDRMRQTNLYKNSKACKGTVDWISAAVTTPPGPNKATQNRYSQFRKGISQHRTTGLGYAIGMDHLMDRQQVTQASVEIRGNATSQPQ